MKNTGLNAKNLAIAGGLVWGIALFIIAIIAMFNGYGKEMIDFIATIYVGYGASPLGGLLGFVYGFVDAFIGLFIFALLYNWLNKKN